MKAMKHALVAFSFAAMAMGVACTPSNPQAEDQPTADAAQAVLDCIMTRTSVRQFTDRPIAKDTLDILVKAGMAAPSAMNLQPWAFVVVTDRVMLDSLEAVHPFSNLKTTTAAICVCGDLSKAAENSAREYWIQDCSAATENILLAAHALGLGAVWCGVHPNPNVLPGVKRVPNLPEHVIPLNIITMGYPAGDTSAKDKWTKENVHEQKW